MHATVKSCGVSAIYRRGRMTIQQRDAGGATGFPRPRNLRGNPILHPPVLLPHLRILFPRHSQLRASLGRLTFWRLVVNRGRLSAVISVALLALLLAANAQTATGRSEAQGSRLVEPRLPYLQPRLQGAQPPGFRF
jgi:hypothetical protein